MAPAEVARLAAANGVEIWALTDHDDTAGLPEAAAVAREAGIAFINGAEISVEWQGQQIHIVGLDFDPQETSLAAGLAGIRAGRIERARRMAAALARSGIGGAFEGAMRHAQNPSLISRAHFARYLVEAGVCKDVRSVFDSYLVPGKVGYVEHRWATLADCIGWIRAAGGIAVIAHPARYKLSSAALRRFFGEFKDLGGRAIEVVSGSHAPEDVVNFARLAREFGFLASRGSDFHGVTESFTAPGRLAALPDGLPPVWEAFQ